jgi:hypothetical protein
MIPSQTLIPLNSGAYQSRSKIANYQVCENLFPETNPQDTSPDVAVTHYPREGKRLLSGPPIFGPGRGIFALSNGALYAVVGQTVYFINPDFKWIALGNLLTSLTTPVSISDNGTTAVLVDNSPYGYTLTLSTNASAILIDPTGTFRGSIRVDYADTFFGFSVPGSNEWYVSLSNQAAFNALVVANKDSTPDPIQTFAFNLRQAWLLGTRHSEIWYLAGSTPFPYQEWPNVFVPYGCIAPYSLTQADVDLFWLSANSQGEIIAVKTSGYSVSAISTRALEYEWSTYPTCGDVIAGSFQLAGHTFIVFHFPSADKTWAYDLATTQWHQRTYTDGNGVAHREKTAFYAAIGKDGGYPQTIVGQDWSTGQLYALDTEYYTDNGQPIVCRRSFPHIVKDMHFLTPTSFVADFDTGEAVNTDELPGIPRSPWSSGFSDGFGPLPYPNAPTLFMRSSRNGGGTFSNYRPKNLISSGHYRSMMRWRGLGMGRDWVFELMWAINGKTALQGAYVDVIEHAS